MKFDLGLDFEFDKWIISVIIITVAFFLKYVISRYIKKRYILEGIDKRYLITNVKNFFNLLLIISLMVLWGSELQKFAFSIAAFIVAIILATKELILCFVGFVYISANSPFRVGDWIQLNDTVGEVSGLDWAKVSILEVDPVSYSYTGKSIFLPNSVLMSQPVRNLNYMKRYVNHKFNIVFDKPENFDVEILSRLNENAINYCIDFSEVADRYSKLIKNRLEIKISGPKPDVKLSTTDIGKMKITITLFCPTEKAKDIEQKLTIDFFRFLREYCPAVEVN